MQNATLFRNLLLQNARVAIDDASYSVGEGCSLIHIPTAWSKVIKYESSLTCNDRQDIDNHLVNEVVA